MSSGGTLSPTLCTGFIPTGTLLYNDFTRELQQLPEDAQRLAGEWFEIQLKGGPFAVDCAAITFQPPVLFVSTYLAADRAAECAPVAAQQRDSVLSRGDEAYLTFSAIVLRPALFGNSTCLASVGTTPMTEATIKAGRVESNRGGASSNTIWIILAVVAAFAIFLILVIIALARNMSNQARTKRFLDDDATEFDGTTVFDRNTVFVPPPSQADSNNAMRHLRLPSRSTETDCTYDLPTIPSDDRSSAYDSMAGRTATPRGKGTYERAYAPNLPFVAVRPADGVYEQRYGLLSAHGRACTHDASESRVRFADAHDGNGRRVSRNRVARPERIGSPDDGDKLEAAFTMNDVEFDGPELVANTAASPTPAAEEIDAVYQMATGNVVSDHENPGEGGEYLEGHEDGVYRLAPKPKRRPTPRGAPPSRRPSGRMSEVKTFGGRRENHTRLSHIGRGLRVSRLSEAIEEETGDEMADMLKPFGSPTTTSGGTAAVDGGGRNRFDFIGRRKVSNSSAR